MNAKLNTKLISPGDAVVAAVSGGADSVALLVLLSDLVPILKFRLSVCHLNHQLRGEAADADEGFVRALAAARHLPIYVERQDVKAIRAERGGSLEETARAVRYEFFARAAGYFQAAKIALGHHRDDQVETVLFNLLRGTGLHGLRGMRASRPLSPGSKVQIIRPLLNIPRAEIETYLKQKDVAWRTDATNAELQATRNVLRHKVLPALAEANPSFREHLVELSHQAERMEAALDEQAERVFAAVRRSEEDLRIEPWRLATLPELVASEVIRKMLLALGAGLGKITARHLRDAANRRTRLELPDHVVVRREYGWLILARAGTVETTETECFVPREGACRLGRWELTVRTFDFDPKAFEAFLREKTPFEEWLDADAIRGTLVVRYVRAGDRFRPLGAPGSKKVGDFLTDVKAGISARPAAVITDEAGIVWLIGRRMDERIKVNAHTKRVLALYARVAGVRP